MNPLKQIAGIIFSITLLACFAKYFVHFYLIKEHEIELLAPSIETSITDLKVSQFNQKGILINQLNAPLVLHHAHKHTYLFHTPHLLIAKDNQPPWVLDAQLAQSFDGGQRITFSKNVTVHQNAGGHTQESTLRTEHLTYYPKEKKASSHVLVTFEQPGNLIQSIGMNAYLDEQRVELLHHARGRYDKNKA